MLDKSILAGKVISELQTIAESLGLEGHQRMRKGELIQAIVDRASRDGEAGDGDGQAPSAEASGEGAVATDVETAERSESPNGEAAGAPGAATGAPESGTDGDGEAPAASVETESREGETRE